MKAWAPGRPVIWRRGSYDAGMNVHVNGTDRDVKAGTTVRALVEEMGMGAQAVAAEVNKQLVPRRKQEATVLKEGDVVELVSLVGGG